eukprot:PhF_6_TR23820/c1_g1_i2/m.33371
MRRIGAKLSTRSSDRLVGVMMMYSVPRRWQSSPPPPSSTPPNDVTENSAPPPPPPPPPPPTESRRKTTCSRSKTCPDTCCPACDSSRTPPSPPCEGNCP